MLSKMLNKTSVAMRVTELPHAFYLHNAILQLFMNFVANYSYGLRI